MDRERERGWGGAQQIRKRGERGKGRGFYERVLMWDDRSALTTVTQIRVSYEWATREVVVLGGRESEIALYLNTMSKMNSSVQMYKVN